MQNHIELDMLSGRLVNIKRQKAISTNKSNMMKKVLNLGEILLRGKAAYYDIAATYAFLGNKVKAYQYLDEFNKMNFYPLWRLSLAKHDPLFDKIRNEERFQKILQNIEAKYQAEHDRVQKWLEGAGNVVNQLSDRNFLVTDDRNSEFNPSCFEMYVKCIQTFF